MDDPGDAADDDEVDRVAIERLKQRAGVEGRGPRSGLITIPLSRLLA